MAETLRDLTKGQDGDVSNKVMRLNDGFKRAGYDLIIRNNAWLRRGGIRADEYVNTKEGGRYRGAMVLRLGRGDAKSEVRLSATDPAVFEITHGSNKFTREHIDGKILDELRRAIDTQTEDSLEPTLRLLQ